MLSFRLAAATLKTFGGNYLKVVFFDKHSLRLNEFWEKGMFIHNLLRVKCNATFCDPT